MNILYHHRTMGRGAEGSHIAHVVNALKELGHCVIVISPPGVDPLAEIGQKPLDKVGEKANGINRIWQMISRNAPQIFFELLEIIYNFQAILKLSKAVGQHKIDFIYERNAFFLFAGAFVAQKKKIPLIIEANEAVGIKRARKLIMSKIARYTERFSFNRAKSILTVSSYLAELIGRNSISEDKIQVIPNSIDPTIFQKKTKREEIRLKYALNDKIVLGFAGWFDWWDRLDILIDVQNDLLKKGYDNVVTLLIGHGNMVEDLRKQIGQLGLGNKVILTGPVNKSDVIDYIDALDIGVLPHSNEFGSPMILFEMMALGKCVVAPAVAPVTDVVIDMDNGLLFTPLDKIALKSKIAILLRDECLRKSIGERAKKNVFAKHTWQQNAEQIMSSLK